MNDARALRERLIQWRGRLRDGLELGPRNDLAVYVHDLVERFNKQDPRRWKGGDQVLAKLEQALFGEPEGKLLLDLLRWDEARFGARFEEIVRRIWTRGHAEHVVRADGADGGRRSTLRWSPGIITWKRFVFLLLLVAVASVVIILVVSDRRTISETAVLRLEGVMRRLESLGTETFEVVIGDSDAGGRIVPVVADEECFMAPRPGPGEEYWLRSRCRAQVFTFRLERCPGGSQAAPAYAPALGDAWVLERTSLKMVNQSDTRSHLKPAGLRPGDVVHVEDSTGRALARVRLLQDHATLPLPVATAGRLLYRLSSTRSQWDSEASARLAHLPIARMLLRDDPAPPLSGLLAFDELSGEPLSDGRLWIGRDSLTQEAISVGFMPGDSASSYGYYPGALKPLVAADGVIDLRPRVVACRIEGVDVLTKKLVRDVAVTVAGPATYQHSTRTLALPPPEASTLAAIELKVTSAGYHPARFSLIDGQRYPRDGHLQVNLERTHKNIVLIWPASRGMAQALGKHTFTGAEAILGALVRELQSECGPLGYGEVEVLVLKEGGLEEAKLANLSYDGADQPGVFFNTGTPCAPARSIYDDSDFGNRFGRHTVVIAFSGLLVNVPPVLPESTDRVMHLHLVRLGAGPDAVTSRDQAFEAMFDAVTTLETGIGVEQLGLDALTVADDVTAELRRVLGVEDR